MDKLPQSKEWLPNLSKQLAVRVNGYLNSAQRGPSGVGSDAENLTQYTLQDALDRNATDIHLEPFSQGWRIRLRIDGYLHDVAQLESEPGWRLVRYLKTLAGLDPVASFHPQDASTRLEILGTPLDLRIAFVPCHAGEALAVRILNPNRVRHRIEDLGLASEDVSHLRGWLDQICGMCLATGPTGSGKTTTLYALLHELVLSDNAIITIEDPVEYAIDGITQINVDHVHGLNFADGLKAMLRLDPDFMLVGEMRDAESSKTAVEAAASGHVVMSTMHSPDTVSVVTLLRGWGVPDHQIASVRETGVPKRARPARRLAIRV